MVLDEDALEAMLRRQNRGASRNLEATLTDETEEFEVYERASNHTESEEAPEPPMPTPPLHDAIVDEEEDALPDRRAAEPVAMEDIPNVPVPVFEDWETEPEPEPEPIHFEPRSHAPPAEAPRPAPPTHTPEAPSTPTVPHGGSDGPRIAIVQALFNQELTDMMADLAVSKAKKLGAEVAIHCSVPGVYDLPLLTQELLRRADIDCAVVLGVVVQGETKHDELITHATAQTLQRITLETGKPIGMGISGPGMTWAQAEARVANGAHAVEAAVAQVRALATL